MKPPLKGRAIERIPEIEYYEINLPAYLQLSLDTLKYDERENLLDCIEDDLYGSINSAEVDGEISSDHAWYLRERYLGLTRR